MKVLVTGASGFIGGKIAKELSKKYDVVGVYRKNKPVALNSIPKITLIQDNLIDPQSLPIGCKYLIHAAADTPQTAKSDHDLWKTNHEGMKSLLKWCKRMDIKKILYFSTMAIYGDSPTKRINEKTQSTKPNAYGESKLAAEWELQNWSYLNTDCECVIMRLPGVVGLGAKYTFIPRTVQRTLGGEDIKIHSFDSLFNNVVHVDSINEYISNWISREKNNKNILFNVASRNPIRLEEVAKIILTGLDKKTNIIADGNGRPPFLIETELASKEGFKIEETKNVIKKYLTEINKYSLNE